MKVLRTWITGGLWDGIEGINPSDGADPMAAVTGKERLSEME